MFLGKGFVRVRDDVSRVCPQAVWCSVFLVFVPCDQGGMQLVIPEV